MTLVCAAHPQLEAIARCVSCGLHLCGGCRKLDGVRNYCARCCGELGRATAPHAFAVEVPAVPALPAPRSPWLGAFLSLVPGLGQAYAGRVFRGLLFFGGAMTLREQHLATPLLAAFLYVFNLFDAWRLVQNRNEGHARGRAPTRVDDVLFLAIGLGCLAVTMLEHGGFFGAPNQAFLPLAALGATILVAHETRR